MTGGYGENRNEDIFENSSMGQRFKMGLLKVPNDKNRIDQD